MDMPGFYWIQTKSCIPASATSSLEEITLYFSIQEMNLKCYANTSSWSGAKWDLVASVHSGISALPFSPQLKTLHLQEAPGNKSNGTFSIK